MTWIVSKNIIFNPQRRVAYKVIKKSNNKVIIIPLDTKQIEIDLDNYMEVKTFKWALLAAKEFYKKVTKKKEEKKERKEELVPPEVDSWYQ